MNGSFPDTAYHPALVLAAGTLTFFGFGGVGNALARAVGLELPSPWRTVVAALLGIQCVALCVELPAMASVATRPTLMVLGVCLLAIGCVRSAGVLSRLRFAPRIAGDRAAATITLVAVAALASSLLTAMAPSSKIDEIYYHMLVPARIAAEGALTFYREPWEAAIWPQMAFQTALTPLHALGVPDAGNVVGWWLGATLVFFAWKVVADGGGAASWSVAWAAALCTGLYPAIWHVTAGSHPMGDLALSAGVVAFLRRRNLIAQTGPMRVAALVSVLALAAASSKVSLLPVSILLLAITFAWLARSGEGGRALRIALVMAGPWAVFFAPLACWTAWASGSPFGPVLSDVFPGSVYGPGAMRQVFIDTREANATSMSALAFDVLASYSPLVWLGVAGAFFCREIALRDRVVAAALLAVQILVIGLFVYPGVRFLGGLHYGLAIGFAAGCAAPMWRRLAPLGPAIRTAAALVLLIPWLGLQVYYAAQFFPVSVGLQAKESFYERYIAFYRDFGALERILPADAVLLCTSFRLGSVYATRPVFFDPADVPPGRPVYALIDSDEPPDSVRRSLGPFAKGELVYRNAHAVVAAFRTPGRARQDGPIEVIRLIRR